MVKDVLIVIVSLWCSFKKHNSNAQGTYSRVRNPNVESDSGVHAVHNGPDEQQPTHSM